MRYALQRAIFIKLCTNRIGKSNGFQSKTTEKKISFQNVSRSSATAYRIVWLLQFLEHQVVDLALFLDRSLFVLIFLG